MALFKVQAGKVSIIHSKTFDDEAALQKLFDSNLEDITGIRLIESQYPIPNGRIDSLGIDELGRPVVIEYKWGHDPGAIVQGLSYLKWVKDNRRTFEMLVREKLGKLKVDWPMPRLLIVAKEFSDKEVSAISLFPFSVELKRYSFYGDLLSIEDAVVTTPVRASRGVKETEAPEKEGSVEDLVKRASPELQTLFFNLRDSILRLGDDVREKVGGWYCDYRKSSTFATLLPQPKKNRVMTYIKMGEKAIKDPKNWTSPIPPSWSYGRLNTRFAVTDTNQLSYATKLIKQAYDYVP